MEGSSCRFGHRNVHAECLSESKGLIKVFLSKGAEMAEDLTQRVRIDI